MEQILEHLTNAWNIYLFVTAFIGILIGGLTWINSVYVKLSSCLRILHNLGEQFQNNSGSTIKDLLDRVEAKSKKIEFMLQVYLDITNIPIFVADNNGKCTWANRAYLKLVGMELNDIVGTGWEMVICDDNKDDVIMEWYRACQEIRPFHMRYNICNNDKRILVKCESYGQKDIGYIAFLTEVNR